jgi:hypothetical protein
VGERAGEGCDTGGGAEGEGASAGGVSRAPVRDGGVVDLREGRGGQIS